MFSDMFVKLWQQNLFLLGVWQTIYLTVISTVFAYVLGLPLGLLLCVSDKDGIHPMPVLNKILSILINAFRSVPFIILMVAMLPVAKFIVGTSLGNKAVIVTLVIAAAPYVARMVESSIKEVDKGVIEAAEAMGTPRFQIITKVLVPEAKPSLITGAVISMVTVLGYSAMAATIGGTVSARLPLFTVTSASIRISSGSPRCCASSLFRSFRKSECTLSARRTNEPPPDDIKSFTHRIQRKGEISK